MAPGSDPPYIRAILQLFEPIVEALSLCGAGAGGFGVLILKRNVSKQIVTDIVAGINANKALVQNDADKLTLHSFKIDTVGLASEIIEDNNVYDTIQLRCLLAT